LAKTNYQYEKRQKDLAKKKKKEEKKQKKLERKGTDDVENPDSTTTSEVTNPENSEIPVIITSNSEIEKS
jgi:hypothetical protein